MKRLLAVLLTLTIAGIAYAQEPWIIKHRTERGVRAMSQADLTLTAGEYPGGGTFRGAVNGALEAVATCFSGPSIPEIYPFMWWANTADGYLYQANAAGDGFNVVRPLDPSIPLSTGAAGIYAVAYDPPVTSYKQGVIYPFKADKDSAVGVNTFNINGIGAKAIIIPTAFLTGNVYYLYYDLVNDRFLVMNSAIDPPWVDYSATSTIVGWSSFIDKVLKYKKIGTTVFVYFLIGGTSNSATATFTLPLLNTGMSVLQPTGLIMDNSALQSHPGLIVMGLNTSYVTVYKTMDDMITPAFSGGTKMVSGQFFYEVAP